jgi:hypothetical protein
MQEYWVTYVSIRIDFNERKEILQFGVDVMIISLGHFANFSAKKIAVFLN